MIDQSTADPIAAMTSPMVITQVPHVLLSALVAIGGGIAAVYAWSWLRGDRTRYNRAGILIGAAMLGVSIPLQWISGHLSTVKVYEQAEKSRLANKLLREEFITLVELVSPRGVSPAKEVAKARKNWREL